MLLDHSKSAAKNKPTTLIANSLFSKEIAEKIPILVPEIQDFEKDIFNIGYEEMMSECPICFNEIDNDMWIIFDCNHSVCLSCLEKIYHHRGKKKNIDCPICRKVIEVNDFISTEQLQTIDNQVLSERRERRERRRQRSVEIISTRSSPREWLNKKCCAGVTVILTFIFMVVYIFYDPQTTGP